MAPPRNKLKLQQTSDESWEDFSNRSLDGFKQEQWAEEGMAAVKKGAARVFRAMLDAGQRQRHRVNVTLSLDPYGVDLLDEMASQLGVNRCRIVDNMIFGAAEDVARFEKSRPKKGWSERLGDKLMTEGPDADLSEFDKDED